MLNNNDCVLSITLMDRCGNIQQTPFNFWRDKSSANPDVNRTNISNLNVESTAKQFVSIATEKQIKVRQLPNFKSVYSVEPVTGDHFIVKAETMVVEGIQIKTKLPITNFRIAFRIVHSCINIFPAKQILDNSLCNTSNLNA